MSEGKGLQLQHVESGIEKVPACAIQYRQSLAKVSDLYRDFARPGGIREDGFTILWNKMTTASARVRIPRLGGPEDMDIYRAHGADAGR